MLVEWIMREGRAHGREWRWTGTETETTVGGLRDGLDGPRAVGKPSSREGKGEANNKYLFKDFFIGILMLCLLSLQVPIQVCSAVRD